MKPASEQLQPVKDNTLRAQIAEQLREMVTSGRIAPGERLTETRLADELLVSRAPLREAIRELVDQGILVSQAYRGLFVRPVSSTDLKELYSMRINLEQFAFKIAWDLRTRDALEDLHNRYEQLLTAQKHDQQASVISNEIRFHSWVYELSRHSLLQSYWERMSPLVQIYLSLHQKMHGSHGEFGHMTIKYLETASGHCLEDMLEHIEEHMQQGLETVIKVVSGT